MKYKIVIGIYIFLMISFPAFIAAYRQGPNVTGIGDPNTYIHQKITKEAEN